MTDAQAIKLMVNLNTRIVVGLIDAAERADTAAQRTERLAMARDAAIEFKAEIAEYLSTLPKENIMKPS